MRKRRNIRTLSNLWKTSEEEHDISVCVVCLCTCVSSAWSRLRWLYLVVAFSSCTHSHTKSSGGNNNKRYFAQKHETLCSSGWFFTVNCSHTELQTTKGCWFTWNLCCHETNTHVHTILNYRLHARLWTGETLPVWKLNSDHTDEYYYVLYVFGCTAPFLWVWVEPRAFQTVSLLSPFVSSFH